MQYLFLLFFTLTISTVFAQKNDNYYLFYVQNFADRLLATAKDEYGSKNTQLWASVINAKTGKIPQPGDNVTPTEGTRPHDRAVYGSNFYHDLSTIKAFRALSQITGDEEYEQEAQAYAKNFLRYTQHPKTNLLGWGEHLYYHFYEDTVAVADGIQNDRERYHEFLAITPAWPLLWEADSVRTRKAIEALRFHFRGYQTQSFLFNRHANWDVVHPAKEDWEDDQFQRDGQPWIKHSALLSYSFQFLHEKTDDPVWQNWAQGVGQLYWRHRNPNTNLVVSCIDDQRTRTRYAQLPGMMMLSYWLLKAYELNPQNEWSKEQATTLLRTIEAKCWDEEQQLYRGRFELDGTMIDSSAYEVFTTGYSSEGMLLFGRIAAYFAQRFYDPVYTEMVKRTASVIQKAELSEKYVINSLASVVNFHLDAYDVTGDKQYLEEAKRYADIAIHDLYHDGLFVRQPGDDFYEAKLRTGNLVLGLLRLHLRLHPELPQLEEMDWSI